MAPDKKCTLYRLETQLPLACSCYVHQNGEQIQIDSWCFTASRPRWGKSLRAKPNVFLPQVKHLYSLLNNTFPPCGGLEKFGGNEVERAGKAETRFGRSPVGRHSMPSYIFKLLWSPSPRSSFGCQKIDDWFITPSHWLVYNAQSTAKVILGRSKRYQNIKK